MNPEVIGIDKASLARVVKKLRLNTVGSIVAPRRGRCSDAPGVSKPQSPGGRSVGPVSAWEREKTSWDTCLLDFPLISFGGRPHAPDAHLRPVKSSLKHASQKRIRKRARFWGHVLDTACPSELVQWLSKWVTAGIGDVAGDPCQL